MTRCLIVSSDVVGEQMAAVGIRYWNIAGALARADLDVILAVPGTDVPVADGFQIIGYGESSFESLSVHLEGTDVLVVSGYVLRSLPELKELAIPIIVDLWAPFLLENLEVFAGSSLESQMKGHRHSVIVANEQLQAGDFFVCASEKQRDFWLGALAANMRLNPYGYAQDPTFYRTIAVVPYGLPREPAQHVRSVLKGVHPNIGPDDKVILWCGGIWQWYDPLTLIRAMPQILAQRQDVKLVFLGVHHPNPSVFDSQRLSAAIGLSRELGLSKQHVFFLDWVPYEETQNYLLEADIGAVLHHNHIETRFSFRARVLSFFWASLPILITEGSPSSDIVREEGLGCVVGYEDVAGTARAILDMLSRPDPRAHYRPQFERISERYAWDRVVRPIVEFCRDPHLAPDKGHIEDPPPTPYWQLPLKAWRLLRDKGLLGLSEEVRSYVTWKSSK